jgi:DNA-binding transcriptional MocR family regulator
MARKVTSVKPRRAGAVAGDSTGSDAGGPLPHETLYEHLAADIATSIENGTLRPGDRLPSVRQLTASRGVSPATVFEAYYLLEARGLVRARPRSGYYVAPEPSCRTAEPEAPSNPDPTPRLVQISDIIYETLQATASRQVVPLGSAFPSPALFPWQQLARTLAQAVTKLDPWATVESLTPGHEGLRRQIALRYLVDGVRTDIDQIIVTNGAMEALNLSLAAVTKPGDAVVVESPCFYACLQAIERLGLRAIEVPTCPRTGIELEPLEQAIVAHKPAAVWLMTNFQNPLTSSKSFEQKRALVALLHKHQLPLVEDDAYLELFADEGRVPSTKVFDDEGWVLHCSSFSKTLAPGFRVGWVSAGRFTKQVAQQKLAASLATSVPVQAALANYLARGHYERHLRALRARLRSLRDQYSELIAQSFPAGTRISRPAGGYFLWVEMPAGVDALSLGREAMEAGISLAPGPLFSASRDFAHCVRINCGHPLTEDIANAVRLVGALAARHVASVTSAG